MLHAVMLVGPMLAATSHALPALGRSVPLLVIAGLAIGLAVRRRWAFAAALVLDSVAVLALVALAIAARSAFPLVLATVAGGGTATYFWRRPRPVADPVLELMRTALPHWVIEPGRGFEGLAARAMRSPLELEGSRERLRSRARGTDGPGRARPRGNAG